MIVIAVLTLRRAQSFDIGKGVNDKALNLIKKFGKLVESQFNLIIL